MSTETTDEVVEEVGTAEEAVEATDEQQIEAPEASSSETESTGDDSWVEYAAQQGLNPEDLSAFGVTDQAGVDQVINYQLKQAMQQQPQGQQYYQPEYGQQQQGPPQEELKPWEYQAFEGQLPADLYDETFVEHHKGFEGHLQGQMGALNEAWQSRYQQLEQANQQIVEYLQGQWEQQQQQYRSQELQRFDDAVTGLGPDYESLLGKGSTAQMPDGILRTNRLRIVEAYETAQQAAQQLGRNMTPEQLVRFAVDTTFPDITKTIATQQVTSAARNRQRQAIGRPNQSNDSDLSPEDRAKRRVRQILEEKAAAGGDDE